jgi:hypothetical protein
MALIFGGAILYEGTTGDLSTLSEFGGISIRELDKYFSQTEGQESKQQSGVGDFLDQQSDR